MPDKHVNFAVSTVLTAPSPATTGLSLGVAVGDGVKFATPPFNCIVCPAGQAPTDANAEIVRITAIAGDGFTILRQQETTSARAIIAGDQIFAGATAKTFTDTEQPIGAAQIWFSPVAPAGYLVCDGSSQLRASYPLLSAVADVAAAAGAAWGPSDSLHFSLPNMQGRVPVGVGTAVGPAGATAHALGAAGGEEKHTLLTEELAIHDHYFGGGNVHVALGGSTWTSHLVVTASTVGVTVPVVVGGMGDTTSAGPTGSGTPHNNMQSFLVVNYIIRAL